MDSKNDRAEMPEGFVFGPFESAALDRELQLKFVRKFRETWEMLPDDSRTVMFKQIAGDGDVEVELRDDHPRFRLGPSGDADAQFFYKGTYRELLFRCDRARVLEGRGFNYWIAHELAHLYLHIVDEFHGTQREKDETEVRNLLELAWGYSLDDRIDCDEP